MIINTYATEQVARHYRQEREASAAASRLAREVRSTRGRRTSPNPAPAGQSPIGVRIPRQRHWFDALVSLGH